MAHYTFYQLDVFTRKPLCGNPLAVFPYADGLDSGTMQALAREMNLSETTFVTPSLNATRKIRFFTPTAEIPLAGHPTIGTWWLLAELGQVAVPRDGSLEVTQETGRGVLPVRLEASGGALRRVIMSQPLPEWGPAVERVEPLARALGCPAAALVNRPPPQVVCTALPQLMVQLENEAILGELPSGGAGSELAALLRSYGTDCVMCFCADRGRDETPEPKTVVKARMFAPGLGVPEDPATGSAAGALGCYLVRHGLARPKDGKAAILVLQGREIGRPSEIEVEIGLAPNGEIDSVLVGGAAVTVIRGEVRL
ncbi:MAG: phenazine biosynthesis protein PhzF [Gemmatimonadales bacterium]|nr:MAG: phenazine biosynthesis protein PhzF [Gemmatimonadales bacterium]